MRAFHIRRSLPWKPSQVPTDPGQVASKFSLTGQIAIGTAPVVDHRSVPPFVLPRPFPLLFFIMPRYRSHLNIQWSLTTAAVTSRVNEGGLAKKVHVARAEVGGAPTASGGRRRRGYVRMCNYPFIPESHFHTCPKLRASAANMIRMHSHHRMIVLCLSNNIIDGR